MMLPIASYKARSCAPQRASSSRAGSAPGCKLCKRLFALEGACVRSRLLCSPVLLGRTENRLRAHATFCETADSARTQHQVDACHFVNMTATVEFEKSQQFFSRLVARSISIPYARYNLGLGSGPKQAGGGTSGCWAGSFTQRGSLDSALKALRPQWEALFALRPLGCIITA